MVIVVGVGIMAAGKVNVSRKDLNVCGDRVNESMDVGDGIVLPPPEKRRKLDPNLLDVEHNNKLVFSDGVHTSLTDENYFVDDQEPGQLDEEDFSHAPNILTSRWAYDDDDLGTNSSEDKGGATLKGKEIKGCSLSPESGVTHQESSDGSGV